MKPCLRPILTDPVRLNAGSYYPGSPWINDLINLVKHCYDAGETEKNEDQPLIVMAQPDTPGFHFCLYDPVSRSKIDLTRTRIGSGVFSCRIAYSRQQTPMESYGAWLIPQWVAVRAIRMTGDLDGVTNTVCEHIVEILDELAPYNTKSNKGKRDLELDKPRPTIPQYRGPIEHRGPGMSMMFCRVRNSMRDEHEDAWRVVTMHDYATLLLPVNRLVLPEFPQYFSGLRHHNVVIMQRDNYNGDVLSWTTVSDGDFRKYYFTKETKHYRPQPNHAELRRAAMDFLGVSREEKNLPEPGSCSKVQTK